MAVSPDQKGGVIAMTSTINLASQAITTADQVVIAQADPGMKFLYGILTVSATLGTAVVAIGTGATHGANGQFRAAAVQTVTDVPNVFGLAAAQAAAALTARQLIYLTCATANLPAAGTVTVTLFYSQGG